MMHIGIFSRTYSDENMANVFKSMAQQGIFHTQFNFQTAGLKPLPDDVSEETLKDILQLSRQYGVELVALTGTFNMIDPNSAQKEAGIAQFENQCQWAKRLGIKVVTLCTGSKHPTDKWEWHDDNLKASSWDEMIETMKRLVTIAEANDVILGVETEVSNVVNTSRKTRQLLDTFKSDHLKVIMDGANLMDEKDTRSQYEVIDEAFALLGKDIVIAHAKDYRMTDKISFASVGHGDLDFDYYIQKLKSVGYQGALIMHGLEEDQIVTSKAFLEEILKND